MTDDIQLKRQQEIFGRLVNTVVMDDIYSTNQLDVVSKDYEKILKDKPVSMKNLGRILALLAIEEEIKEHNLKESKKAIDHNFEVIEKQISLFPKKFKDSKNSLTIVAVGTFLGIFGSSMAIRAVDALIAWLNG